jgi:hypothetical protein
MTFPIFLHYFSIISYFPATQQNSDAWHIDSWEPELCVQLVQQGRVQGGGDGDQRLHGTGEPGEGAEPGC